MTMNADVEGLRRTSCVGNLGRRRQQLSTGSVHHPPSRCTRNKKSPFASSAQNAGVAVATALLVVLQHFTLVFRVRYIFVFTCVGTF